MRTILIAFLLAATCLFSTSATAQHCERTCYRDCSSGRCCTRCVCRRSIPGYVRPPEPQYVAPQLYYEPSYQGAGIHIDPAMVGLAIIALAVVIGGLVSAASTSAQDRALAETEQSTQSILAQAHDDERRTTAIRRHIAAEERAAYEEGRRMADKEWFR